jgi:hypothetical protein
MLSARVSRTRLEISRSTSAEVLVGSDRWDRSVGGVNTALECRERDYLYGRTE